MKWIRISADVWVNLKEVESVTRNTDGTALLQGRNRIYETTIPFEAIAFSFMEREEEHRPESAPINSPLIADTRPAW